ncbi:hypothetical protein XaC1_291 [Xanthomonas phage XaC1]|nr:hypothetical protein XaC1_291 [Xanthomonas phage XaC1]
MSNISRDLIVKMIVEERLKQLDSPNSTNDSLLTKNDWTAKIGYYLYSTASRPDKHISFEEFRESLITVGALVLSALENSYEHESNKEIDELLDKIKNDGQSGTL